jgi:ABC-2 type transport system ATP-binding protein
MEYAIRVEGLVKRYEEITAVDGVRLEIPRGEVFGLLGPNGAGKTTTVECLLGLREPDNGQVAILGMNHATHSQAIRSRVGVQLQSTGLLPHLKVREQISLFASLFPSSLPINEVIELVGLDDKARVMTTELSGGQKQRLAVALALINDPELIFLDEPTTGLDPQARRALWEVILDLKQQGKTILLTTHYMEEAEQLCDRVAILDHGKIIELGRPVELIGRYFEATAIEFVDPGYLFNEGLDSLAGIQQVLRENGHVTLYSTNVSHTLTELYNLSSRQAVELNDMTIRQATLEDVFLKLTGRRIRS